MNQFDRLIEQARNKALKKASAGPGTISNRIVREPSLNEVNKEYTPPGYGVLFCPHKRSYFDTCPTCKRDRKRAQAEFDAFCQRRGISV